LRKESVEDVLRRVEVGLGVRLDRDCAVTKRRSVGARSERGTWIRIEVRQVIKIVAQGQVANGMEAAEFLTGIAKPAWYGALSWLDAANGVVWRADEVQLDPGLGGSRTGSSRAGRGNAVGQLVDHSGTGRAGLPGAAADLDTRSGKLMALFNCAKILNDSSTRESPIFEPTARLANKLIADLR
jgi:hypothetical protein